MKISSAIILILSTFIHMSILLKSISCQKPRIAILGAGIGGSSCAHFLNEHFDDAIELDVYEAKQIGGRLATIEYEGSNFETGGAIVHARNKYMNRFQQQFQLKKKADKMKQVFGIYDDGKFDFVSSNYEYWTLCKMLWRYGLWSLLRLRSFIEKMLDQFDRIYELQEQGRSFVSVEELFMAANWQFMPYFNISSQEGFSKHAKVNKYIIEDLVRASLRVNYGQSIDVHLFVGSVSVAGMFGSLWSVDGGNKQVPERLLKSSKAKILHRLVTKVIRDSDNKQFIVEAVDPSSGNARRTYDIVVVANPITADTRTAIEFSNFTKPIKVPGVYHRTVATIVSGTLNGSYFGLPENEYPKLVINNDESDIINSIGTIEPIDGEWKSSDDVWKVFSQRPLEEQELDKLFQKRKAAKIINWLAYPHYDKLKLRGDFVLDKRLFYVNSIEWAASAMEMSVIGAKNVALLVQKELQGRAGEDKKSRKVVRDDL